MTYLVLGEYVSHLLLLELLGQPFAPRIIVFLCDRVVYHILCFDESVSDLFVGISCALEVLLLINIVIHLFFPLIVAVSWQPMLFREIFNVVSCLHVAV